tara:strand:- start:646 stop:930 length:285 start_codon:yes stop_codon:yes gene_type:complete
MKIYKASYYDEDEGWILAWFTNKAEAHKYLSEITYNYLKRNWRLPSEFESNENLPTRSSLIHELNATVQTCEFKATRQGIVDWLTSSGFAGNGN